MPGNAISWWSREPAYLLWGDRGVVSKLLVGWLSTVDLSAGFYDELGRGINWKWGKVLNKKKVLFHRAHNCVCHSCYRVLRLSAVQVVLISDSINWWRRYSFWLWYPALQLEISRERVTMYLPWSIFPYSVPENGDLHCPGLCGFWLCCKATFLHNS